MAEALRAWLERALAQMPERSAPATAILYGPRRSSAPTRHLNDGSLPINNNWLFAGSARTGRRAPVVMSLIQSARLKAHDPYAHLGDRLERLPLTPERPLGGLLPHLWKPDGAERVL